MEALATSWRLLLVMNIPNRKLSFEHLGITASRLLLPLDLAKCPLEIFQVVNGVAKPFDGEVILLHVLDPRKNATSAGLSEITLSRARRHLERLGRCHLKPTVDATFRARIGIPHEEILAEAAAANVDLIVLPTFSPSIWRRLAGLLYGETVRNLVATANCRVFVIEVQTRFNCFRRWAGQESLSQCTT
jgi:nucleotide-binding universal stress UspA family protein